MILSIWIPVVEHFYVADMAITNEMVKAARHLPADPILEELRQFRFLRREWRSQRQLISAAEKLRKGEAVVPGYPPAPIGFPFDASDIDKGPPSWQLALAAFAVPEVLLDAYEATGRDEFLLAARDVILGWASYERAAWFPRGFLWNDHATAARVVVLTEFWRLYRDHPAYEPRVARSVLRLVERSRQLLAKPSHFTFSTNHGVLQNLALLHISLAFPTLPASDRHKQVALSRLSEQMTFFVNDEGVVLEHSAGYHASGQLAWGWRSS